MELVTIEVKLPKEVYDSASEILAKQGLTMEDALILFLKETVRLGRIPFDYTEADLEEARRWERIVNDDVQDIVLRGERKKGIWQIDVSVFEEAEQLSFFDK